MLVLPCKICGGFVKPILEVFSCPVSHSNSSIHRQPKTVWKLKTEYEQKTDLLCVWMKLSSQKQTLINVGKTHRHTALCPELHAPWVQKFMTYVAHILLFS
jgi:hypothetical protein